MPPAGQSRGKKVSLADLIVLGGCAGVEGAARKAVLIGGMLALDANTGICFATSRHP
jgi:catalase (peroxidase I)